MACFFDDVDYCNHLKSFLSFFEHYRCHQVLQFGIEKCFCCACLVCNLFGERL